MSVEKDIQLNMGMETGDVSAKLDQVSTKVSAASQKMSAALDKAAMGAKNLASNLNAASTGAKELDANLNLTVRGGGVGGGSTGLGGAVIAGGALAGGTGLNSALSPDYKKYLTKEDNVKRDEIIGNLNNQLIAGKPEYAAEIKALNDALDTETQRLVKIGQAQQQYRQQQLSADRAMAGRIQQKASALAMGLGVAGAALMKFGKEDWQKKTGGAMIGTGAGLALGAQIGTAIAPGIGTAVGAALGGLVGAGAGLLGASVQLSEAAKAQIAATEAHIASVNKDNTSVVERHRLRRQVDADDDLFNTVSSDKWTWTDEQKAAYYNNIIKEAQPRIDAIEKIFDTKDDDWLTGRGFEGEAQALESEQDKLIAQQARAREALADMAAAAQAATDAMHDRADAADDGAREIRRQWAEEDAAALASLNETVKAPTDDGMARRAVESMGNNEMTRVGMGFTGLTSMNVFQGLQKEANKHLAKIAANTAMRDNTGTIVWAP